MSWCRRKRNRLRNGKTKHHLVPKCRFGKDEKQNLLILTPKKHELWHKLWGNRTIEEVLALLSRMARAKKNQK